MVFSISVPGSIIQATCLTGYLGDLFVVLRVISVSVYRHTRKIFCTFFEAGKGRT